MAKTTFATGNALTNKIQDEKLFRDTVKETYFQKFHGNGPNSLVHVKTQLEKEAGDTITFGIRMRLSGAGVTSGQTLEGNEENLTTYDDNVTLEEYAHAVRDHGPLDRKRVKFSLDDESSMALKDWGAEKIDQLHFDVLCANHTRVFYRTASGNTSNATAATAKAALVASTSNITPSLVSQARVWAMTGGNRSQTPLRGIKIDGKNHLVLLVHPDVAFDLKQDSTYTQANREAMERGKMNPLFSGAIGVWDGVIIHEHENIPIATDAGAGGDVPWANCVMMGAQSLVYAQGARKKIVGAKFDYDREHGMAWSMICGIAKPTFNSLVYGSIGFYVSRSQISDAS